MNTRKVGFQFILLLLFSFTTLLCSISPAKGEATVEALLHKAEQSNVAFSRYWKILLHYESTLFGWESEVDSAKFFLSPEGKTDPEKELAATLNAFFSAQDSSGDTSAQCRFRARFEFLDQQFDLGQYGLVKKECKQFNAWLDKIDADSVSLIFPSFYLKTPASMFGHTLLRVDSKKSKKYPLLSHAVNYAALANESNENPIKYVLFGLFGGYSGMFSMIPYYLKVQEYNDIEMRDIWEYRLSLTPEEIRRMLAHLWELDMILFDYYFFKENCSYRLLSALEAARPSLRLQDQFTWWAIPADTIREVAAIPGLVVERKYRPSRWSKILQGLQLLNEKETEIFYEIIEKKGWEGVQGWGSLSRERMALILEIVNQYYVFTGTPEARAIRRKVLLERARQGVILPKQNLPEMSTPPEEGHKTSRLGFAMGNNSMEEYFGEVELRASYHDLLANDHGFLPNSQIEGLRLKARYYREQNKVVLEEFTVMDIKSIIPRHRLQPKLSWKMKTGVEQLKSKECTDCPVLYFEGGLGVSYEIPGGIYYSFMELRINYGESLEGEYQAGTGLTIGFLHQWGDRFKTHLVMTQRGFEFGERELYQIYKAEMSLFSSKNTEIRLEGLKIKSYWESKLSFKFYF